MTEVAFAVMTPSEGMSLALKVLAVIGGAAVGGLLIGALGGTFVRLLTTRQMPVWGKRTLRVVGGVATGWLVAFLIFHSGSGGWGFGGPGGISEGSANSEDKKTDEKKEEDKKDIKKDDKVVPEK